MKQSIQQFLAVAILGSSLGAPIVAHAQATPKVAPAATAPAATTPAATTPAAAAPAAAAPASPTPPPPAPAPPVTAETRTAVNELLQAMNMRDNLAKNFQGMSQTLGPQMAQALNRQIELNTALSPEQKTKVREGMNQPFEAAMKEAQGIVTSPKLVDETIQKMVPIYAKYFTTPEIKQLTTFYKSSLGAKTLTTMPQVIGESLQASFADLQPRLNALMEKTLKTQVDAVTKK